MTHLTDTQLESFDGKLSGDHERLREEIREQLIRNGDEGVYELAGNVRDRSEESVADLLSEINTTVLSHLIRELREIEESRKRIQHGDYGICQGCGVEIPLPRLEASPTARCCIDCQQLKENQRGY